MSEAVHTYKRGRRKRKRKPRRKPTPTTGYCHRAPCTTPRCRTFGACAVLAMRDAQLRRRRSMAMCWHALRQTLTDAST